MTRGSAIRPAPSDPARFEGFLEGLPDAVVICDALSRLDEALEL